MAEPKRTLAGYFSVEGRFGVITGAGGGLCGEMARSLAAQGARVAVLDRGQLERMEAAVCGSGSILNISSMNPFTPLTRIPAYAAAKAAVTNFTRWLAVLWLLSDSSRFVTGSLVAMDGGFSSYSI